MTDSNAEGQAQRAAADGRPSRIALLIGNADYPGARLLNPVNDVRLLEGVLQSLGFEVEVELDCSHAKLRTAIVRFGERIEAAGADAFTFFYFAGHGVQYMGSNYLLPIDAEIPATRYLKSGAIKVDTLVEELSNKDNIGNIIVLDACRDNPIPEAYRTSRDVTQGLANLYQVPDRTLVVFSTNAGGVSLDGDGRNSPYAAILAEHLAQPGRTPIEIFQDTAAAVSRRTNGEQRPAMFLQGGAPHIVLKGEIDRPVNRRQAPPIATAPATASVPPPRPEVEPPTMSTIAAREQPAPLGQPRVVVDIGTRDRGSYLRDIAAGSGVPFRDVDSGPEMVVVPAGTYTMGDREESYWPSERPAHPVTIPTAFAIGRFAVTVAQFAAFAKATNYKTTGLVHTMELGFPYIDGSSIAQRPGRSWCSTGIRQRDDHPVVCIGWEDARAYASWLASITGKPYRLPTEAEWEYAARAGDSSNNPWGSELTRAKANYCESLVPSMSRRPLAWWLTRGRGTCPVDQFEANAWGLFNTLGNTAEWVEDTWHFGYVGAPADGSAWTGGDYSHRVIRGGSWLDSSTRLRWNYRDSAEPSHGASWIGFRVARTLPPVTLR